MEELGLVAQVQLNGQKNADEMKVGNDKDGFVLPSRALFKSL